MGVLVATVLCALSTPGIQGHLLYFGGEHPVVYPPYIRAPQIPTEGKYDFDASGNDLLYVVQAVNCLVSLGQERALSFIRDFGTYWGFTDEGFPYWLTRLLFVPKSPDYLFPTYGAGQVAENRPKEFEKWKTYPKFIVDGIPFHFELSSLGIRGDIGNRSSISDLCSNQGDQDPDVDGIDYFVKYLDANSAKWTLRKDVLVPPDDPFLTLDDAVAVGRQIVPEKDARRYAEEQILALVRTVCAPKHRRYTHVDFLEMHEVFKKLGGHWDRHRNIYVRRSGFFDQDEPRLLSPDGYEFVTSDGVKVKTVFKFQDRETVRMSVDCFEIKGNPVYPIFVSIRNARTGEEVELVSPNVIDESEGDGPHVGRAYPQRASALFNYPISDPVEFEMTYRGKVFKSPVIVY